MASVQPLIDKRASTSSLASRPPAADAGFLERELGTSMQRCFFMMLVGQVVDLIQTVQLTYIVPDNNAGVAHNDTGGSASGSANATHFANSTLQDAQNTVLDVDGFTSVFSSFLMLVGAALYLHAMHPSRILLSSGYNGGANKEPVPDTFWNRHFGTDLLVAGQVQLIALLIFVFSGAAQVVITDDAVEMTHGFLAMTMTTKDALGWENILAGVAGTWGSYVLNQTSYPDRMTNPGYYATWLDYACCKSCLGQRALTSLKLRLMNDNIVLGWLFAGGAVLWLVASFNGSMLDYTSWLTMDVAQPACYVVSALFMLDFGYNEGTMLDPVLFGCHRTSELPTNHPMGPMFNAHFRINVASYGIDVDAGIDAALKTLELPWTQHAEGVWLSEDGDVTAMKVEIEVGLHPFALAQIFHTEDAKKEEPACDGVRVVEKLSDNAVVFHTSNCADPPMPRSDQVFVSALREPKDEGGPVVVAEWSVRHPEWPEQHRVVRNYPFQLVHLAPTGPASTKVTVVIVTTVACWMPKILVRDELAAGAKQIFELMALPGSKDGKELLQGIEGAVWSEVGKEAPPCLWDCYVAATPGIKKLPLEVFRKPLAVLLPSVQTPSNPCEALGRSPEVDPLVAVATALAFANTNDWKEVRGIAKRITERGQTLCRHKHLAGAMRASTRVLDIHPALLGLMLNSAEFKRSSDSSIVELREIQKVSDKCSVWYQRSNLGKVLKERDSVYASLIVDAAPDRVFQIEWPVEVDGCPAEGLCACRAKTFFCYEVKKASSGHSQLTVTAVLDMGGSLGSRFLRPVVDRSAADTLFGGLAEMSGFFRTEEGKSAKADMEKEVQKKMVGSLRPELSPTQLGFMEACSEVFQSEELFPMYLA